MSTINNNSNTFPVAIPAVSSSSTSANPQRFAATEAQLEVWLSSKQCVEANCAYNEISSLTIRGDLDLENLKQAIGKVIQRHTILRSTFSADGQQIIVHEKSNFDFELHDWSKTESSEVPKLKQQVVAKLASTPFNLETSPSLRVVVQIVDPTRHVLTFAAHHAVLDGWSLAVFCKDLGHFYDQLSGIDVPELPPANQYQDYTTAMETYFASDKGQADEAFWTDQYSGSIPMLDLPIESRRPKLRRYAAERYDHDLSVDLVESVRKIGVKQGCSLYNVMLAAFNAYVARLSGNDDFCIGIPTAGQAAMDQTELIGHCVNTLPLRTSVDTEQSFQDYMKQVRTELLNSLDHQRYSYGMLLRKLAPPRDASRLPMVSVSFNVDPVIDANEAGFTGLDVDVSIEPRSFENFEWAVNGVIRKDKSVELQVQYNTDLYSASSMAFYFEGFSEFLKAIAASPESPIDQLPMMSIPQRQQVIADWNDTHMEYPLDATLSAEFSRQAAETPEKVAVKFKDVSLTYAEVETQSNQIARFLQSKGVEPGDLVGICVERSERMLVYLYGILKASAGYVPLDPAYPSDRLQYMCDHSKLKLIVTENDLKERVAEFNKPQIEIDSFKNEISQLDKSIVKSQSTPTDICYVIYTSGSTGEPKGVQIPHGAVINFLYAMRETPGFASNESVLAVTTLSFDIAVLELYLPTIFGGCVVIMDTHGAVNGEQLSQALVDHDISLLQATPGTWRLMIQSGWKGKPGLKVLCGGEPMPNDLVQPLLDRCSELWNMYGPTETTVWSAAFQIKSAEAQILIGKPIGNTQIYILGPDGQEVPVGAEGEVFIGGAGVTLGYRNRQDLTDERFVENPYRNPFTHYVSDRLYKTGDLARYQFDGNLQFLRRNDKQVKVRGFRIELGEIEQNIESHAAVQQNVVIVREDTPGDHRLVAYFVARPGHSVDGNQLREHLRQSVPYYMLPQHFVMLDAFPQTNNGKIDYKALPAPRAEAVVTDKDQAAPNTPAEVFMVKLWAEVLESDDVGLNDTFFDVGGHSLLAMKVISHVKEKVGVKLDPQDFLVCTLQQLAEKLDKADAFKNGQGVTSNSNASDAATKKLSEVASATEVDKAVDASADLIAEINSNKNKKGKSLLQNLKGFWD